MQLARALEDKKLDLRLRDKLLHEGKISKVDLDKYLDSLPDDASNLLKEEEMAGPMGTQE